MFTQQADTLYLFLCPIVCIYGMMSKKKSTSKKTKVRVVMYFWTFWKKCEQQKKKLLSDIQSKLTSLIPFSRVNKHSVLSLLVLTEKLKHI